MCLGQEVWSDRLSAKHAKSRVCVGFSVYGFCPVVYGGQERFSYNLDISYLLAETPARNCLLVFQCWFPPLYFQGLFLFSDGKRDSSLPGPYIVSKGRVRVFITQLGNVGWFVDNQLHDRICSHQSYIQCCYHLVNPDAHNIKLEVNIIRIYRTLRFRTDFPKCRNRPYAGHRNTTLLHPSCPFML